MKSTAQIVKETRLALGLTQQKLAERLGVSRYCIVSYETSRAEPPGGVLLNIFALASQQATGGAVTVMELLYGQADRDAA